MTRSDNTPWPLLFRRGLLVFAVAFAATFAWCAAEARDDARPHLTVIGSGEQLSMLVVDGPARLLIASGDDPAAFGNGLAGSRPFVHDRIDVLVLAGQTNDVTFLSRAIRAAHARHVEVIGKPELTGRLGMPPNALVISPRRFKLIDRTTVTIETVDRSAMNSAPSFAWRALIEHGATRILVVSDGRAAGDFPSVGRVSALVVGGEFVGEALRVVRTGAVVTSAVAITGKQLRAEGRAAGAGRLWLLRVYPGEDATFGYTSHGLTLPDSAEPADGSPVPM